ncbi:MAG: hypothetical protein ACR2HN_06965 [Tepidiformaceae bacterium]
MEVFLQHVGSPGNHDIAFTVTKRRDIDDVAQSLPPDAPERPWFEGQSLRNAFPGGSFNCWGVPPGAEPRFRATNVGDLVLFFPQAGVNGALEQIGVIKALCPVQCWDASRVLWPSTPGDRLFPHVFFFKTEIGYREWSSFLDDVDYSPDWDPRGWYRRIASRRLHKWGGAEGYLSFLRGSCGFHTIG